ncbi:unnamed protein product [Linum tenue]|uniref:Uncharacterized protein n=1 Tax=Linum tenue TaxID=586396 RepID=A0AAV0HRF9_9ROSI|nr:unnamed protein product [Linum tenue]CAI0386615.1 unnamed protein product [Linum tenue]
MIWRGLWRGGISTRRMGILGRGVTCCTGHLELGNRVLLLPCPIT